MMKSQNVMMKYHNPIIKYHNVMIKWHNYNCTPNVLFDTNNASYHFRYVCVSNLYVPYTQNRDYNRSPTPVYDMAPFLHCACVRSAIFLASKTAASNSKLYGESFGQCKKTAIKS